MNDSTPCPTGMAESELLTVVFPNNQLASRLWDFFLSGHMVDFSFSWGCQTVRAHRLVLEAYFSPENLCQYAGKTEVANVKLDQNDELYFVMEFLYRGQITVPRARLNGLRQIAKELDLKVLAEAIDAFSVTWECDGLAEVAGGGSDDGSSNIILEELPRAEAISGGINFDMDVTEVVVQEVEYSANELERAISALNPSSDDDGNDKDWEPPECDDSDGSDWLTSTQSLKNVTSVIKLVHCGKTEAEKVSSNCIVAQSQTVAKAVVRGATIANHVAKPITATTVTSSPTVAKAMVRGPTNIYHVAKPIPATTIKSPTVAKAIVRGPINIDHVAKSFLATTIKSPTNTNHVAKLIPAATSIISARPVDQSEELKPLKCEFCRYATASQANLYRHTAVVHPANPMMYKCLLCKYESASKLRYRYHMYTVHGTLANGKKVGKNFKCTECTFAAVNGSQLRNHMLGKHATEKRFKCEHCPYACRRHGTLNAHVRNVHQRQKRFICETCGLRINSQGELDMHKRRHTGEKPYSCEICGSRFAGISSLKNHSLTHKDERPFVCPLCERAFSRRYSLKVHLKNVHKTEPEVD